MLTGLFSFVVDVGNRRAGYLDDRLVSAANEETGIADSDDRTDNAARRDHTVANLQTGDSFLQLSLALLLRPY